MIGDDMSKPNIKIAQTEQDHLAWIFGCICGVRPGALGVYREDKSIYLRWKHIQIRRETATNGRFEGRFTAYCLFTNLKSRNVKVSRPGRYNQLRLTVRSPRSPNLIPLSLPHRLLVILVRRGFLRDYTSIDELLVGKHVKILIKQEFMEQPVMLKSSPHRILLADSPRTVDHYTKYLKRVAIRCGLGAGTMYTWRNKASTEVARAVRPDKARLFMNHSAKSKTFEEDYDQAEYDLDVTVIALSEDHLAGAQSLRGESSPALYRATIPPRGTPVHKAFVETLVFKNEFYCQAMAEGHSHEARLHRIALRRQANQAWEEYHRKLSEDQLTMDQVKKRVKELRSSPRLMSHGQSIMSDTLTVADAGEG
ncbi:MAG: hypothetical protein Q9205_003594 [Flavoplaca limonia]